MLRTVFKRVMVNMMFLAATISPCIPVYAAILNPYEYILLNDSPCGEGGYENCLNSQSNFFARFPGMYSSKELMYKAQTVAALDPSIRTDSLYAIDFPGKTYSVLLFGPGNRIQLKDDETFTTIRSNRPNEFVTQTPFQFINRYNEPVGGSYASLSLNGVEKSLDDLWGITDIPYIEYLEALYTGASRNPYFFTSAVGINKDGWIYGNSAKSGDFLLAPIEQVQALSAPIPEPQTYAMMIASIFILFALNHKRLRSRSFIKYG